MAIRDHEERLRRRRHDSLIAIVLALGAGALYPIFLLAWRLAGDSIANAGLIAFVLAVIVVCFIGRVLRLRAYRDHRSMTLDNDVENPPTSTAVDGALPLIKRD